MSTQRRVPDVFAAKWAFILLKMTLSLLPDVQACWLRVEAQHLFFKAPSIPGDSQRQDTSPGGTCDFGPCFLQHRYLGGTLFTQGRTCGSWESTGLTSQASLSKQSASACVRMHVRVCNGSCWTSGQTHLHPGRADSWAHLALECDQGGF